MLDWCVYNICNEVKESWFTDMSEKKMPSTHGFMENHPIFKPFQILRMFWNTFFWFSSLDKKSIRSLLRSHNSYILIYFSIYLRTTGLITSSQIFTIQSSHRSSQRLWNVGSRSFSRVVSVSLQKPCPFEKNICKLFTEEWSYVSNLLHKSESACIWRSK